MSGNKDKDKQGAHNPQKSSAGGKSVKTVPGNAPGLTSTSTAPPISPPPTTSSKATSNGPLAVGMNSNKSRVVGVPADSKNQERRPIPGQSKGQQPSTSHEVSSSETDSFDDSSGPLHILELPDAVVENVFTFLKLTELPQAALVCKKWANIILEENNEVWRSACSTTREINADVNQELLSPLPSFKAKLRAFRHAWNPHDCSRNIFVRPNGFTIHRNPVAQSTDGVRGKIGFSEGRHAWEVIWEGPLGTVAVVGIATRRAEMRAQGYIALLGQDEHSWGWNLVENTLLHNGDSQGHYPLINNAPRYQVGERIRVILDCDDSTLAFEKDFEFLGVAFRGLPTLEPLFPSISAVYGNTEVSMVYLGPPLDG